MSEIRVNKLINEAGTGSVELTQGATLPSGKTISGAGSLNITGISTFGGNVSIAGTLTYQDVTNIDSVGIVTARGGIKIGAGQSISAVSGIITYYGDGSKLSGVESGVSNFVATGTIANGATVVINTDGTVGIVPEVVFGNGQVQLVFADDNAAWTATQRIVIQVNFIKL